MSDSAERVRSAPRFIGSRGKHRRTIAATLNEESAAPLINPHRRKTTQNTLLRLSLTHSRRGGLPAEVNGMLQIGLSMEDADDLADLLNRIHAEQSVRA